MDFETEENIIYLAYLYKKGYISFPMCSNKEYFSEGYLEYIYNLKYTELGKKLSKNINHSKIVTLKEDFNETGIKDFNYTCVYTGEFIKKLGIDLDKVKELFNCIKVENENAIRNMLNNGIVKAA